jgi:predicted dehydrogenase
MSFQHDGNLIHGSLSMRRRDVLIGAGAIAASACTPTSLANSKKRLRVGQIGTKHGHALGQMSTLRSLSDEFEVVGVVEPDESQRDRVRGQKAYADIPFLSEEELLGSSGLQIVAVETEVKSLVPTAQRCARAGMHVFLDKPPGESLISYQQLLRDMQQRQRQLQMGYLLRYNPAFEFMFRAIEQGWLGTIFSIHAEMSKSVGAAQRQALAQYQGGSMFELGCHLVDPIVKIMGTPQRVTPHILHTRIEDDGLADNMVAVLDYANANVVIRSAVNEVGGFQRRQFVVMGQEGTLAIRPLESNHIALELARPQGDYAEGRHEIKLPSRGRYDGLWLDLASAVRGAKELEWDASHNLATHKVLLEACGY